MCTRTDTQVHTRTHTYTHSQNQHSGSGSGSSAVGSPTAAAALDAVSAARVRDPLQARCSPLHDFALRRQHSSSSHEVWWPYVRVHACLCLYERGRVRTYFMRRAV